MEIVGVGMKDTIQENRKHWYITKLYAYFGGKTMFIAIVSLAIGTVLAFHGKLTNDFVLLVAAVQGIASYRAIKQESVPAGGGIA